MSLRGKRIAFVVYDYPLAVSVMVVNSLKLLAEHNDVVVFVGEDRRDQPPCDAWLAALLVPHPQFRMRLAVRVRRFLMRNLLRALRVRGGARAWRWLHRDVELFAGWLKRQPHFVAADIIIPVECVSLIAAHLAGARELIYFNMELLDWSDSALPDAKRGVKALEHAALARVSHVMITSEARADIFARINAFARDRVSALPVVPLRQARPFHRSTYFRERFGFSPSDLVILYSGNFQPWAQCVEIIQSMDTWPRNAVLVMHTWNAPALDEEYFQEMRAAAMGRRVYFSSDFILAGDLSSALSSADIGLMFYQALDDNFTEIAFSSNKMAEYIAGGLPIACSPLPSLLAFVENEGIGLSTTFEHLGQTIARIALDAAGYRQRVAACRRRHFEFEPYFESAFSAYGRTREE